MSAKGLAPVHVCWVKYFQKEMILVHFLDKAAETFMVGQEGSSLHQTLLIWASINNLTQIW
jgi:hypothetical protein